MPEVIEGEATEIGTELEPVQQTGTLFRTDDPVEVIERASRAAEALKGVLDKQGLTQNIQGKAYVKVEGWTTLGSMLGVVPVCTWTREIERGWEARVEARTLDGRVVGAAEAQCSRDESRWASRDAYALRSMAQTRATSKALRGPLGFIVTLAGYEATPSDEMPRGDAAPAAETPQAAPPRLGPTAIKQLDDAYEVYEKGGGDFDRLSMQAVAIGGELRTEGDTWADLTHDQGHKLFVWLQDESKRAA